MRGAPLLPRGSLLKSAMEASLAELIDGKYAGRLKTPDGKVITSKDLQFASGIPTIQDLAAVLTLTAGNPARKEKDEHIA